MTKTIRCLLLGIPFLGIVAYAFAAPLNNDGVIRLLASGLNEATVLQAIDSAHPPQFDTSPAGLIDLKKAGASDAVIQRVLRRQAGRQTSAPAAKVSVAGGECKPEAPPEGQYMRADGQIVRLSHRIMRLEMSSENSTANALTFGIVEGRATAVVRLAGERAALRIHDTTPVILDLLVPVGRASLEDMIYLARLTVKDNSRTVEVARAKAGSADARAENASTGRVPVTVEKAAGGCEWKGKSYDHYRMKPTSPLEDGEYALLGGVAGDKTAIRVYDFGVERSQ